MSSLKGGHTYYACLLYTSPSPRDLSTTRMPSSAWKKKTFDLWEGADFTLKIRNVEGFRNYDKSELDVSAPLFDEDEQLEKIWKSQYALAEFTDPKNFKTYEELQTKLNRVLGLDGSQASSTAEDNFQSEPPAEIPEAAPAVQPELAASDDDESLDFFKKLAAE